MTFIAGVILIKVVMVAQITLISIAQGLVDANANEFRNNAWIAAEYYIFLEFAESLAFQLWLAHIADKHVFKKLSWRPESRLLVLSIPQD
jgi:hypothetical protein